MVKIKARDVGPLRRSDHFVLPDYAARDPRKRHAEIHHLQQPSVREKDPAVATQRGFFDALFETVGNLPARFSLPPRRHVIDRRSEDPFECVLAQKIDLSGSAPSGVFHPTRVFRFSACSSPFAIVSRLSCRSPPASLVRAPARR